MKSVLCNKGYIISKKKFSDEIIKSVKTELKVKPFVKGNYGRGVKSFKLYIENDQKLCVPKYYGLQKFGIPEVIDENNGIKTKIKFKGKLRDYQEKIMDIVLPKIRREGGGLISILGNHEILNSQKKMAYVSAKGLACYDNDCDEEKLLNSSKKELKEIVKRGKKTKTGMTIYSSKKD